MNKHILRQSIVILSVLATIAINGLANALPLNGQTTGAISDRFEVFFVPAGYVFAIWGLIYLGIVAYAIYQALPSQRENPRLMRTGYLFALSGLANIIWLFLWHYEQFVATLAAMLALLGLLLAVYLQLGIGKKAVPAGERWLVHLPISIYLGWITVATIANFTSVLDYINWSGWGITAALWAVIMLATGAGIAAAMSLSRRDVAYLLVLVWAFSGIAVKQAGTALVANAAWGAASFAALMVLVAIIPRRTKSRKPRKR